MQYVRMQAIGEGMDRRTHKNDEGNLKHEGKASSAFFLFELLFVVRQLLFYLMPRPYSNYGPYIQAVVNWKLEAEEGWVMMPRS